MTHAIVNLLHRRQIATAGRNDVRDRRTTRRSAEIRTSGA